MDAYVAREYRSTLERHFEYIFNDAFQPPTGSSKPRIRLHDFRAGEGVKLLGRTFHPVRVPHGGVHVYGFRVGSLGYVTDAKSLTEEACQALEGVDVLVLNALWFGRPHASHFNVEEAVEAARALGAKRTYLTHLTHKVRQSELDARLPDGVYGAYDGLSVEI